MATQFHFISGLPRAGSTLLCNILNQNPRFHATSTSGILDIIRNINNGWEDNIARAAAPNKRGKMNVMKGILPSYYADVERPVVFDKSRGWVGKIELAEAITGEQVKVLVPVRKITDILGSFEKLFRKNEADFPFPQAKQFPMEFQTIAGRAEIFMKADQPVGYAYQLLQDAFDRGYGDRLCLIPFTNLTSDPGRVMDAVYDWLGEERFVHDFDNVEQTTHENDDIHGIPGLHTIRGKVSPLVDDAQAVLGDVVYDKWHDAQFWER